MDSSPGLLSWIALWIALEIALQLALQVALEIALQITLQITFSPLFGVSRWGHFISIDISIIMFRTPALRHISARFAGAAPCRCNSRTPAAAGATVTLL